jgi:thioredoxin-like negative regulator of GroEL
VIVPQLTTDGLAVRLPVRAAAAPLLDDLALAYAQDPDTVGRLLAAHAARVVRLDHAVCSEDMPDHVRAMRAAEADGTREALLDECPTVADLDPLLDADQAVTLAGRITRLAARIRHRATPEGTRP